MGDEEDFDNEDMNFDDFVELDQEEEEEDAVAVEAASLDESDDSSSSSRARKRARRELDSAESLPAVNNAFAGEHGWTRAAMPPIDARTHHLALLNVEADHYLTAAGKRFASPFPESQRDDVALALPPGTKQAVVRIFGVDADGHSILVHVHHFLPYLYVAAPPGFTPPPVQQQPLNRSSTSPMIRTHLSSSSFGSPDLQNFFQALQEETRLANRSDKELQKPIIAVEVVQRQSIWGYHSQATQHFLKITVANPALVATTRRVLERGISIAGAQKRHFSTYESNLPFVLRFMVDKKLTGAGWLSVPGGAYTVRAPHEKTSRCQLEVDCHWHALTAHESEGEWLKAAPMRVLSFDIECAGRAGFFPSADQDPVIQIACCLSSSLALSQPIQQVVFTLNTCSPIVGATVISCMKEEEMFRQFLRFWLLVDADIITGYNCINFDLFYLIERAKALHLKDFCMFGRILGSESTVKNSKFESKAFGIKENKEIRMEGRIQLDCLEIIRREHKLRSYTLNSVSAQFLGQQKEDVHYSIISDLQNGDSETRHRLAVYCLKDAKLPLLLLDKLMIVINLMEMARVTGVSIIYLLTRGQQIKVVSQLYRAAQRHRLVIPIRESKKFTDEKYEGATVIEPKKAYYTTPIATLDFASLYPSIMMAHNLCYSTLIAPADVPHLSKDDYIVTPTGDHFVKEHLKKGLLPEILTDLLTARSLAKKQMKQAGDDPLLQAVLNGRQLALKISANSVYGFTGAQNGQLPCVSISSSVTGFGRDMIMATKTAVEDRFAIANGYEHNAEVIYGDTDSVMVRFGTTDLARAMSLGAEAAALVTQQFVKPIKLEFEKVYWPYLLMNKKRYAGLYWTRTDQYDKMDTKGIETVRRDNCALVSSVVETCLHLILIQQAPDAAIQHVKDTISALLTNRLDLSQLVITKALAKSASSEGYANKQAHVELAERMKKRDPRSAPNVGDRIAYVFTKGAKGAKGYDRAEDPIYVLEHSIPIDTAYYLSNQLEGPLTRIFEPILKPHELKSLFHGDHTRAVKVSAPATGGIMRFAVKNKTCMGCKCLLSASEGELCAHCQGNEAEIYLKRLAQVREHEETYARTWTQCQSCQGSLHLDILCSSKDCPIFYRRKKVQKDLDEAQKALDRFNI